MLRSWKLLGVVGLVGVAATGVVAARRRRAADTYTLDELRERLHRRMAEAGAAHTNGSSPDAPKLRT